MMYKKIFDSIDKALWKDDGVDTDLEYIQQTSWLLFLRWLDEIELTRQKTASLNNQKYNQLLDHKYRWSTWAVPRKKDGSKDFNTESFGPEILEFINNELFPYLQKFKENAKSINSTEYKIGEIFSNFRNGIEDGYILRNVIDLIDKLEFKTLEQKQALGDLFEDKLKNMGNAGRQGGQYYTPRPLIDKIIKVINPKIGESIYDGAAGSCGFLIRAFNHIKESKKLSTSEFKKLQNSTLFGKENKRIAYTLGIMNMILHEIENPNLIRTDTLGLNISEIQNKDRFDVILANPPFGGGETKQTQQNFPIKSSEASYLFLQHFVKILKKGGRCGIVIKDTFLSNGDAKKLRKLLLEECNLYSILDVPRGAFRAGVKTVVLFFEKGTPTKDIWYYQLNLGRNLGKTNPLNENDLAEFSKMVHTRKISKNSWLIKISDISKKSWDLSVKNPNRVEDVDHRTPAEIIAEIDELDVKASKALQAIRKLI